MRLTTWKVGEKRRAGYGEVSRSGSNVAGWEMVDRFGIQRVRDVPSSINMISEPELIFS